MKRDCKKCIYVLILLLSLGFLSETYAQRGVSNARSVAMGGAYTALARGVESATWNPANLGLKAHKVYRLNLFSFGLGIRNNSFSKKQYDLYNGSYLTEQDKIDILNTIPDNGLAFDINSEVQAFGLSFGSFAFTSSGYAVSNFSLSKDIADILLNGNDFNRTYDVGNSAGEGYGISSFALSKAFSFPLKAFDQFAVGFSAKYLMGFAYGNVNEATSTFTTDIDGVHGTGRLVLDRSFGGSGFGLDLGAAAKLNKDLTASFGISNVFGKINWSNETERTTYTFSADSVSVQRIADTDLDSVVVEEEETVDIDGFSTNLPRQMRLGLSHSSKKITLAFDYTQGLSAGPGVSTKPRLAFGSELKYLSFLPLRAGIAFGGNNGVSTGAGFGLDLGLFSWNFAVASRDGAFSGKGVHFAFDWMFRF